jgi:ribosomal protein L11 methyltransferase
MVPMIDEIEWAELCVTLRRQYAEAVAEFLIDEGSSNGIVEEKSPTDKDSVILKAYIKNDAGRDAYVTRVAGYMAGLFAAAGDDAAFPAIAVNLIPDEDWNKKWKSFFQPLKITGRIVIKPSWKNYHRLEGEIIVELDPGMAFGTGTHPSTSMCLKVIDELEVMLAPQGNLHMLDVGTGSGILAISAAKLGFKEVVGIDVDQVAVRVAQKNAELNGVAEAVSLSNTPLRMLEGEYPVVVANILPHVLIYFKEHLIPRLATGGFLILSGILIEKAQEVKNAFAGDLHFFKELHEEQWACLVFQKG